MTAQTPMRLAPLQPLLEAGHKLEALAFAEAEHKRSPLNGEEVAWLLEEARGWHTQGLAELQRAVCMLALDADPNAFEALHLLGAIAQSEGDREQAEGYYERALALRPDFPFARLALAQLRMLRTRFAQGRDLYEARFDAVTENNGPDWRSLPIARWRGESLAGKKIYLWAEQGLGDIIMFAGFLPYIVAQGPARIALGMFPKLMRLMARSFEEVQVEPAEQAMQHALAPTALNIFPAIGQLSGKLPPGLPLEPLRAAHDYAKRHGLFDYAAPLGDLMVHAVEHYTPAQHPPYLKPDPQRLREAKALLGEGRCIGISWATTNIRERNRNIPLKEWIPLLRLPNCRFVSLQHQADRGEMEAFCNRTGCRIDIIDTIDLLSDADGLAALTASMDAVVTVDNSNAHMAGALGVKTILLLPRGHNYRWPQLPSGGTLWYGSVQPVRQDTLDDWSGCIRAAMALLGD